MTLEDNANLKKLIEVHLEDALDDVFKFSHDFAKTKSGDISPEQNEKLKQLQKELSILIYEQTIQNT